MPRTKLGPISFALVLVLFPLLLRAELAETKRAELVKLVHYTGELKTFKDHVSDMISRLKATKPEMPLWFWDALEKEVRVDEYLQWVMDQFYLVLSEDDLKQLNVFLGSPEKKAAFEELGRLLSNTPKEKIAPVIAEFRRTHSRELADEIAAFAQSAAFNKYADAHRIKEAGSREETIRLFVEATARIRARDEAGRQVREP